MLKLIGIFYLILLIYLNSENGTSGDSILDQFIFEKGLKWIPYNKFKNVEYLDKGGFSIIYKAIWLNKYRDREVVLKQQKSLDYFLNESSYHEKCTNSGAIIDLIGITKDPITCYYFAIIDYANRGNLRGNLSIIIKNNWKQKLSMLFKIISGLNEIHQQGLIHCDLHDGNILNHNSENEDYKVYISDLGLTRVEKSFFENNRYYGVLPYIAPEILRGKGYTPASDIYSFSMIMWEFTSGVPPFNDRAHDFQLSVSICKGKRPEIIENTPQCYVDLMEKCWNEDPLKRPSALEVLNIIKRWIIRSSEISEGLRSSIMEFINAPIGNNNLITESYPRAYYTSRLLNFTSSKLTETLESECLDFTVDDK